MYFNRNLKDFMFFITSLLFTIFSLTKKVVKHSKEMYNLIY